VTGTAGAEYIRPLDRLSRSDEPRFGGKSANLGELLAAEIPVPPGFAISTAAFGAFVRESGLEGRISGALAGVSAGDVHAISEAMRVAPVPAAVREEVERHYAQIGHAAGVDSAPVAVRSSAVGEDSQDATFAGQQETYLWVRGIDHVCDAVRDCWVSLYSPPAISYRARFGDPTRPPAMGVTVQLMVDAEVSGVMFTCNPVSGDPSMVAINASWGLGLAVVGGEVTPDDYLLSKVTGEVERGMIEAARGATILRYLDPHGPAAAGVGDVLHVL
jgi:pyruvate,water dikinase